MEPIHEVGRIRSKRHERTASRSQGSSLDEVRFVQPQGSIDALRPAHQSARQRAADGKVVFRFDKPRVTAQASVLLQAGKRSAGSSDYTIESKSIYRTCRNLKCEPFVAINGSSRVSRLNV